MLASVPCCHVRMKGFCGLDGTGKRGGRSPLNTMATDLNFCWSLRLRGAANARQTAQPDGDPPRIGVTLTQIVMSLHRKRSRSLRSGGTTVAHQWPRHWFAWPGSEDTIGAPRLRARASNTSSSRSSDKSAYSTLNLTPLDLCFDSKRLPRATFCICIDWEKNVVTETSATQSSALSTLRNAPKSIAGPDHRSLSKMNPEYDFLFKVSRAEQST